MLILCSLPHYKNLHAFAPLLTDSWILPVCPKILEKESQHTKNWTLPTCSVLLQVSPHFLIITSRQGTCINVKWASRQVRRELSFLFLDHLDVHKLTLIASLTVGTPGHSLPYRADNKLVSKELSLMFLVHFLMYINYINFTLRFPYSIRFKLPKHHLCKLQFMESTRWMNIPTAPTQWLLF